MEDLIQFSKMEELKQITSLFCQNFKKEINMFVGLYNFSELEKFSEFEDSSCNKNGK